MAKTSTIAAGPDRNDSASLVERVGNRFVFVLLAVLVTFAAAGTGGVLMLRPATAHGAFGPARTAVPATAPALYARMPAMTFTLNDGSRLRELRVSAVLEFDPATPLDAVTPHLARIADSMSLRMLDVDPAELNGRDGSAYVKDALRFAAAKAIRPLKLRQVLIQDMLLR